MACSTALSLMHYLFLLTRPVWHYVACSSHTVALYFFLYSHTVAYPDLLTQLWCLRTQLRFFPFALDLLINHLELFWPVHRTQLRYFFHTRKQLRFYLFFSRPQLRNQIYSHTISIVMPAHTVAFYSLRTQLRNRICSQTTWYYFGLNIAHSCITFFSIFAHSCETRFTNPSLAIWCLCTQLRFFFSRSVTGFSPT